jgi:hypothetical protein
MSVGFTTQAPRKQHLVLHRRGFGTLSVLCWSRSPRSPLSAAAAAVVESTRVTSLCRQARLPAASCCVSSPDNKMLDRNKLVTLPKAHDAKTKAAVAGRSSKLLQCTVLLLCGACVLCGSALVGEVVMQCPPSYCPTSWFADCPTLHALLRCLQLISVHRPQHMQACRGLTCIWCLCRARGCNRSNWPPMSHRTNMQISDVHRTLL